MVCTGTIAVAQTPERTLELDFPSLHIGVAENPEGPTGGVVFYFPTGAKTAVDVRGGSPATINTEVLQLSYESSFVDAITIAGGSSYGLEFATGVAAELRERRGGSGDWNDIATVAGAIVFDLGPRRFNTSYPTKEMGAAALRAAVPGRFPLGGRGAGRFTTQGGFFGGWEYRQHSGQGGAMRTLGTTKVAVFTVVNSLGAVVDRQGRVVRCLQPTPGAPCPLITDYLADAIRRRGATTTASLEPRRENTTITLVVTNEKLEYWALQRLAVQVHTSMARAIQPFHTLNDGDVLFAVSTGEVDNPSLNIDVLSTLASETAWDAVLASVPDLPERAMDVIPIPAEVTNRYEGTYEFAPGARLTVTRAADGRLTVEATGTRDVWSFKLKNRYELQPVTRAEFISTNPRRDRLLFTIDGVTLNPGPWEMKARLAQ
ncbi:MAG TPA: P1 family peptidase [Thermoanaerobaculia bacterium]